MSDVGLEGQERLRSGKVTVVGLGGLGSHAAMSLTASGVGYLRVVDFDVVSAPDLHRQLLYTEQDMGLSKAEAAARRLAAMNSGAVVEPLCEYVAEDSVYRIVDGVDVVVDCTDSFSVKYLLNRACGKLRKPLVFGSAIEYYGNVASFNPWEDVCLECLYPGLSDSDYPTCAVAGVLPQCVQVVGSIQAAEAIKHLLGSPMLLNTLLFVDMRNYSFDRIRLAPNTFCPNKRGVQLEHPEHMVPREVCSRNGMRQLLMVLDRKPSVEEVYEKLKAYGDPTLNGRFVVEVKADGGAYAYTAAGVILGEVDAQIEPEKAKSKVSELATHILSPKE